MNKPSIVKYDQPPDKPAKEIEKAREKASEKDRENHQMILSAALSAKMAESHDFPRLGYKVHWLYQAKSAS